MIGFFIRTAVTAVALWVAVAIVPGISAQDTGTLVLAAIVLGVINATVRPLAVLLSIPITIVTFGLFLLVVNAGMLALVAWLHYTGSAATHGITTRDMDWNGDGTVTPEAPITRERAMVMLARALGIEPLVLP